MDADNLKVDQDQASAEGFRPEDDSSSDGLRLAPISDDKLLDGGADPCGTEYPQGTLRGQSSTCEADICEETEELKQSHHQAGQPDFISQYFPQRPMQPRPPEAQTSNNRNGQSS